MNKKQEKDISLEQYKHNAKRVNNPEVGLVSDALDTKPIKKGYEHDPYIDPTLSWSGKVENLSFDVDTISLHIHERIDPKRVIKQILKKTDNEPSQPSLFEDQSEKLSIDKEFDFYAHSKNWSNRLVAGDSLLVMNSLLEKENMAGKIQMIYIDPPYGIKYNSNFQPFVKERNVKDRDDNSIPVEPEMIKAFRDTWKNGINSYLTHLRDRLLLAKELLHESGGIFMQISDENVHLVRVIMDDIFGSNNFLAQIVFRKKTMPLGANFLESGYDYIIWYAKNKNYTKYRPLFVEKSIEGNSAYCWAEFKDGTIKKMNKEEVANFKLLPKGTKIFRAKFLDTTEFQEKMNFPIEFQGHTFYPERDRWVTNKEGILKLIQQNRIFSNGKSLFYKLYSDDYPVTTMMNVWTDVGAEKDMRYVVQTAEKVIQRCLLMSTDPSDLVLDITCGGGTTAYVAEQWGRRWITCDTSRVAVQLAKQRLMTAKFDYYKLEHPEEGISSGFSYKTVPHITLGSIANNEPSKEEVLYDRPFIDKKKVRVAGPFTVEAVPGVRVKPISGNLPDVSDRVNPTNLVSEKLIDYLDNIRSSGIRAYNNEGINFSSIELAEGYKEIHALGTINNENKEKRCVIIFGPDYAPMEQTQVERALEEVRNIKERPNIVIFCAYAFDPEASKDIDNIELNDMQILKAQMNTDLLTKDLKKKVNTNKPFWLIGEPDIDIIKNKDNEYQVEVKGFDYYDPQTQEIGNGGLEKIAMWMLDTDYDNHSIFPSQIFFPIQNHKRDWTKLAKALNGKVDDNLLDQYNGIKSIPFKLGENKMIAVKIIDDRGVEMLFVKKL